MAMAAKGCIVRTKPALHVPSFSSLPPRRFCYNLVSSHSRLVCSVSSGSPSSHNEKRNNRQVKKFLEELKAVGRVRIIVNTGVGILESVTNDLGKLFFSQVAGKGEYANLMSKEDNVDFHLLLDKVAAAKLVQGKSMRGDVPTYMVRFLDTSAINVASFLVMWKPGTMGDYDNRQVDAFKELQLKYGENILFDNN